MRLYRTALVWLLRLVAVGQLALSAMYAVFMINTSGISPPLGVQARSILEPAIIALVGPIVCLAIAEILALLNTRNAGNAR